MTRSLALGLLLLATAPVVARADAPKPVPMDKRPTVAILYFDYTGKTEGLGVLRKGLAQMIISDLSTLETIRLVERDRLEEILAELKLNQTASIDPKSAAKVGKLLGARYMVMGGYFDLMGSLRADARVVEVETGKIIQSLGANGKPDDFLTVEQKLSGDLNTILSTKLVMADATPSTTPSGNGNSNTTVASNTTTNTNTSTTATTTNSGSKEPTTTATTATATAKPKAKAKPPIKLNTKVAVRYSKALDALDKGDKKTAKAELSQVIKDQPDFKLAQLDMDKLMQ
jgi:TolB-like protein